MAGARTKIQKPAATMSEISAITGMGLSSSGFVWLFKFTLLLLVCQDIFIDEWIARMLYL